MQKPILASACGAALFFSLSLPLHAELCGVRRGTNEILLINEVTGITVPLATIGMSSSSTLGGLELAPNGKYYAIQDGHPRLYEIDPLTWEATIIATLGPFIDVEEGALAISSSGQAWIVGVGWPWYGSLCRVDLSTGSTVQVGTLSGGPWDINGLAWRSDGMLVGLDRLSNSLVLINPNNAMVFPFATVPATVGLVGGMTIDGGVGYFNTSGSQWVNPGSNELYSFDPFTGVITLSGAMGAITGGSGVSGLSRYSGGDRQGVPYCFGNGSGSLTCPCGNAGGTYEGCANSTGLGAYLEATASIPLSPYLLTFNASNLPPNQPALLFRGESQVSSVFGDGLRCTTFNLVRLGVRSANASGNAVWGPPWPITAGVPTGEWRSYQAWFRDPIGPCGAGFNLSNGVRILFYN